MTITKKFFLISEPRTKGIGALGKFAIGKLAKLANAVKPRPHHFQRKPQKPSYKPPSYKPRGKPSYQNPASALFQRLARPWFGWQDVRYGRWRILVSTQDIFKKNPENWLTKITQTNAKYRNLKVIYKKNQLYNFPANLQKDPLLPETIGNG